METSSLKSSPVGENNNTPLTAVSNNDPDPLVETNEALANFLETYFKLGGPIQVMQVAEPILGSTYVLVLPANYDPATKKVSLAEIKPQENEPKPLPRASRAKTPASASPQIAASA